MWIKNAVCVRAAEMNSFLCLILSVTCIDPGLSNCSTQIVMVNINGDDSENINPAQQLGKAPVLSVHVIHETIPNPNLSYSLLMSLFFFFFVLFRWWR